MATTSLGIGVNVPDIKQVVLWKFLITKCFKNQWQRLNYSKWGYGWISKGYIFLLYWAFNTKGVNRPEIKQLQL